MPTRGPAVPGFGIGFTPPCAHANVAGCLAPSCFSAATGSDDDRPPVAESPARIGWSDSTRLIRRRRSRT